MFAKTFFVNKKHSFVCASSVWVHLLLGEGWHVHRVISIFGVCWLRIKQIYQASGMVPRVTL